MITVADHWSIPDWVWQGRFPETDEDGLLALAETWDRAATAADERAGELRQRFDRLAQSHLGPAADAVQRKGTVTREWVGAVAEGATTLATGCRTAARLVVRAKEASNLVLAALQAATAEELRDPRNLLPPTLLLQRLRSQQVAAAAHVQAISEALVESLAAVDLDVTISPDLSAPAAGAGGGGVQNVSTSTDPLTDAGLSPAADVPVDLGLPEAVTGPDGQPVGVDGEPPVPPPASSPEQQALRDRYRDLLNAPGEDTPVPEVDLDQTAAELDPDGEGPEPPRLPGLPLPGDPLPPLDPRDPSGTGGPDPEEPLDPAAPLDRGGHHDHPGRQGDTPPGHRDPDDSPRDIRPLGSPASPASPPRHDSWPSTAPPVHTGAPPAAPDPVAAEAPRGPSGGSTGWSGGGHQHHTPPPAVAVPGPGGGWSPEVPAAPLQPAPPAPDTSPGTGAAGVAPAPEVTAPWQNAPGAGAGAGSGAPAAPGGGYPAAPGQPSGVGPGTPTGGPSGPAAPGPAVQAPGAIAPGAPAPAPSAPLSTGPGYGPLRETFAGAPPAAAVPPAGSGVAPGSAAAPPAAQSGQPGVVAPRPPERGAAAQPAPVPQQPDPMALPAAGADDPDRTATALLTGAALAAAAVGLAAAFTDLRRPVPAVLGGGGVGGPLWPAQFGPEPAPLAVLPAGMDTPYQLVLAPGQTEALLDGRQDTLSGLLHPLSQVVQLRTPAELFGALGLGFELLEPGGGSVRVHDAGAASVDVLRFAGVREADLVVPVAADVADPRRGLPALVRDHARPWTGTGWAPGSTSTHPIEEVELLPQRAVAVPHLAEIWRLHADGHAEHVATWSARSAAWSGPEVPPAAALPGRRLDNGHFAQLDDGTLHESVVLTDRHTVLVGRGVAAPAEFHPVADGTRRTVVDAERVVATVGVSTLAGWRGADVQPLRRVEDLVLVRYVGGSRAEAAALGFSPITQGEWMPLWVAVAELSGPVEDTRVYPQPVPVEQSLAAGLR
ncbi:hypothetical protein GC722_02260 [Auraticoccus sp. F435]|uniref:Outer membrane channel protein CpnT-like N-terminal domain-containing protein n=1 Tax=Auraticoccus cholistanensis TaxID=2656650 RepID=A0A6A9V062_9ACTN|nr:hypothetical protein [Auraticoccus cholistanensis]MVA74860.1 hypothetical protein [Auraticoccus cholistanensis]